MGLARVLFVAWLASALIPGVSELVDDAMHVALDAHATDHVAGEEACPEHGCAPTSHHCSCCTSMSLVAPVPAIVVADSHASGELTVHDLPGAERPGFARRLPRPPSA